MFWLKGGLICVFLAVCFAQSSNERDENKQLRLTVFYETLDGDSRRFFTQQLSKLFDDDTKLYKYVNFDLVPFGNANQRIDRRRNEISVTCENGPKECEYNKLHGCIVYGISKLNRNEIDERFVPFLICLMKSQDEDSVLNKCAAKYDVPTDFLRHCRKGVTGKRILAKMGRKTTSFRPKIQNLPTIVINGEYNENDQILAKTNLPKLICKHLKSKPSICNNTNSNEDHSVENLSEYHLYD